MDDLSREIADLRVDIHALTVLLEASLERGAQSDDVIPRAYTNVLRERRSRLAELERLRAGD